MSLFSTIPFPNQTVYSIEFPPKFITRAKPYPQNRENRVIISSNPFKGTIAEQVVQMESFRQKVHAADPSLRHHTQSPVNLHILTAHRAQLIKTTYQHHYNRNDEAPSSDEVRRYELPKHWITHHTTQKASYRNPEEWSITVERPIRHVPHHNLTHSPGERKILKICTGESRYMADIGQTAESILKKNANSSC